jgi:glycosyltransferase involved in cell wall biosynthesis
MKIKPFTNAPIIAVTDISQPQASRSSQDPDVVQDNCSLDLSVVIPTYGSGAILPFLVARLKSVLASEVPRHEILFVDDGSMDDTWNVIDRLTHTHDGIRGIRLTRNYGQHNALLCGIRSAHGATIVTMDDDLQHSPEDIPKLLEEFNKGYDVVYGTPIEEQHSLWRNLASKATKMALRAALGVTAARHVSAYRVIRSSLRNCFVNYRAPSVSIDVLLSWGTTNISSLAVHHAPRYTGTSHYGIGRLFGHALNMVTGYSGLPLRLASLIGFASTIFGIGILVYVIVRYFWLGNPVPGFPFLASIIAIFSGAQLFSIGIIGEYLARLHFRMMDRPSYAIRQQIQSSSFPRSC